MYLINEFLEYCDEHNIHFCKDGDYDLCVVVIDNWQDGQNLLIFCEEGESVGRLVPATWGEPEIDYDSYMAEELSGVCIYCYDFNPDRDGLAVLKYRTLENVPEYVECCQRLDTVPMPLEAFKKW